MKAYIGYINGNEDIACDLVFANNIKEAKKKIDYDWLLGDDTSLKTTDIRAERIPTFDGMENEPDEKLALKKWHNGWNWDCAEPELGESTDEEFLAWYKNYLNNTL